MKFISICFGYCFIILWLASCSSEKKEHLTTDVEMKQILIESAPGCNFDSLKCAQFEASYPVFGGLDSTVQKAIANQIGFNLNNGVEGEIKDLNSQAKEFIEGYKEFKSDTPDMFGRWYRAISIEVKVFNDSLLSLQLSDESFEGGAHGSYNLSFVNVRPGNGAVFKLDDFLKPGYEADLTRVGEEIFREARELADTATYEMNGFTFSDNKFALNDNYGFRKEGIVFFYNSYEVAPYSEGPTEIVIPYEKIKDWIKSSPQL